MPEGFSDEELLDFARQCIKGEMPRYDLAKMIDAANPALSFTRVMFGESRDESEARVLLKEAERAAWRNRKRE